MTLLNLNKLTNKAVLTLISIPLAAVLNIACADDALAGNQAGSLANRSSLTGTQTRIASRNNTRLTLQPARFNLLSSSNNTLPSVSTDSFVKNAGGNAETIYGDEGSQSLPPYYGFDYSHRINAGISGQTDQGLTTGHGSYMPSAWGADEILAPPGEQSQSGANGGNPKLNNADAASNTGDQQEMQDATSNGGSDGNTQNLPPSPGPGYQPIFQHGIFVGYMDPNLCTLMQTDPCTAWAQFANSSEFVGDDGLRLSLLYEVGAASPEQQQQLMEMALFD